MKKLFLFLIVLVVFTGCADVTPIENCATDDPYGFFSGLWHGYIVGFSFIGSLFSDSIAIYAVNNSGGWYDFGFLIGSGMLASTGRVIRSATK